MYSFREVNISIECEASKCMHTFFKMPDDEETFRDKSEDFADKFAKIHKEAMDSGIPITDFKETDLLFEKLHLKYYDIALIFPLVFMWTVKTHQYDYLTACQYFEESLAAAKKRYQITGSSKWRTKKRIF